MRACLSYGFFCLLSASILGTCRAHLKSGCKIEALRTCGEEFVPYLNTRRMPETPQELATECEKYKKQIACTLHFHHECTRGRSQSVALATVAALGENIEAVCTPGSGPNKAYLTGVKCMNHAGDKLHACFDNLKSAVLRAVFKAPAKEAIHYTCCAYHNVTGVREPDPGDLPPRRRQGVPARRHGASGGNRAASRLRRPHQRLGCLQGTEAFATTGRQGSGCRQPYRTSSRSSIDNWPETLVICEHFAFFILKHTA
nr:uncharacterized protein LOC119168001 [Rhipicephalus microplus]